jgi:cytochrome P450
MGFKIWAFCLLPTVYYLNCAWCLWKNIVLAKKTRIPYVIVPRFYYNTIAGLALRYPMRLLNLLDPESNHGPDSWRHLQKAIWPWNLRYAPFKKLGVDTFLVVAPGGLVLVSADADVVSQITARHGDFPKETKIYRPINIYGGNIVSAEGAEWRQHRKATAVSFTEKTNRLVWTETLDQASQMLAYWSHRGHQEPTNGIISGAADTMRLSLNIMSCAALGCKVDWLDEINTISAQNLTTGHAMNFTECLSSLLKNILFLMIVPNWVLRNLPFKRMRKIFAVYTEFGRYMQEMILSKRCEIENDPEDAISHTDVISQLVRGSPVKSTRPVRALTDSEVLGNLFVFIIAGHETSANSIHFALILLALNPKIQRRVQSELDSIFEGRPPTSWSYDADLPRLTTSLLQAVLNEQLRMIPPTITIPKLVADIAQGLEIEGKQRVLPHGTRIRLCLPSVHRNPKYWPTGPPSNASKEFHSPCDPSNDLEEFKPDRWLVDEQRIETSPPPSPTRYYTRSKSESHSSENTDPSTGAHPDTPTSGRAATSMGAHKFFSPKRGSFIPFGLDSRACLGKRFATVEILAALAAILSTHTIELGVEAHASADELADMNLWKKRKVWEDARDEGNRTWQSKASMIMTLALRGDARVPFTVVKRGEEVFGPDVLDEEE